MFNEQGVSAVSTNHIAAELQISPGNLYHHFANKEAIVRVLFDEIDVTVRESLPLPDSGAFTPTEWAGYFVAAVLNIYEFRFFFRDLDQLVANDPELADKWSPLAHWILERVTTGMRTLCRQGAMRTPDPPEDLDAITVNMLIVLINWWSFQSATGDPTMNTRTAGRGAIQGFLTHSAYLTSEFATATRAELERIARTGRVEPRPRHTFRTGAADAPTLS